MDPSCTASHVCSHEFFYFSASQIVKWRNATSRLSASEFYGDCSSIGQLPQGALERRRPPSKLRGVRAAGFKSLFGQKSVVEKKKE